MTEYRIIWEVIQRVSNGRYLEKNRMCRAEKKSKFWGWVPLTENNWRWSDAEAQRDINYDIELYKPLPLDRHFVLTEKLKEVVNGS